MTDLPSGKMTCTKLDTYSIIPHNSKVVLLALYFRWISACVTILKLTDNKLKKGSWKKNCWCYNLSAQKLGTKTWRKNLAQKLGAKTWRKNLAQKLGTKTCAKTQSKNSAQKLIGKKDEKDKKNPNALLSGELKNPVESRTVTDLVE